jgi:hypothetical protein
MAMTRFQENWHRSREDFKRTIVENRENLIEMTRRYPVEIEYPSESHAQPWNRDCYMRVVVDSAADIDLVIAQLSAPVVTEREAFNRSISWPKQDPPRPFRLFGILHVSS